MMPFRSPAGVELFAYARRQAAARRASPTDDVISDLLRPKVDGEQLTDHEFNNFFTLRVAAGSRADELYGGEVVTNSLHHQAVGRPGEGVVVTARSHDGVIEAYELEGRPEVFAVQWHPEMLAEQPDPSFTWLVAEAARYAGSMPGGSRRV